MPNEEIYSSDISTSCFNEQSSTPTRYEIALKQKL